ncbi:MAG: valyl-tRNA synthetase, partial [Myxococcota bacterium]
RLLHPFMPYITEEIWQRLPRRTGDPEGLIIASYAMPGTRSYPEATAEIDTVVDIVTGIRTIRGENNISPGKRIAAIVSAEAGVSTAAVEAGRPYIERLGRVDDLKIESGLEAPEGSAVARAEAFSVIVPLDGLVDYGEERKRLAKVIAKLEADMAKTKGKLTNERFMSRAPQEVVEKEQAKLAQFESERESALLALSRLPE